MTPPKGLAPRKELADLQPYKTMKYNVPIKMDANESPFNFPGKVLDHFKKTIDSLLFNRYPDPLSDNVRQLLAEKYGLTPDNFLVGNGGDELIYYILLAYGGRGRKVLSFPPTFSVYGIYAEITCTDFIEVVRNDKFAIDIDQINEVIDQKPDIVFLCNPNNPTGTELPASVLDHLISNLPESLIIVDEAYGEFSKVDHSHYFKKGNVAILKTFSKAFSLAGARLGYLLAPEGIINDLAKVKLPYNVNSLSQGLAKICLQNEEVFEDNIQALLQGRNYIFNALTEITGVTPYPSGANYILFRLETDPGDVFEALLKEGILIRPFFGDRFISDCLRVTIGTPEENIKFVKALEKILEVS